MQRWLTFPLGTAVLLLTVTATTAPLGAHHGWTGYDETKTLTLTGTIRETGYENPHGFVRLQVDGANGKTWNVVLAPPRRMQDRGLQQEMLKVGTMATAVGYAHRTNADELRAERITIAGKTTELR